ncbi:heme-binding domain-containing protein [Sulfurospirillum diekertiae]|uniref:Heme-binding domain-containing protein n=1 Tax=Sulfurospirillum diekertiae TaxID=1854492 RepID=A0A6G9VT54_9BACT|nr:heme-binding domain-containing protein [Sulfurospirillum diekertiae]QIR76070.1 heme-binding domain-containing protein [Sulfurospirillum diekertiae]QIR78707.1 heme-binding domain-containing protein [Sulfurospirillum diekertiae]
MKKILFGVVGILMVIQFMRPNFNNPKVDEKIALQADEKVMVVLKNACFDCHSNEVQYPWYHNVAPVSWVMAAHINNGRRALNFSTWADTNADTRITRIKRAKQLISNGLMPKGSYELMHPKAHLDAKDKKILEEFFDQQLEQLKKS